MQSSPTYRKEWGNIALRYMKYRLDFLKAHPRLNEFQPTLEELGLTTGISVGEIENFRDALLRRKVGLRFHKSVLKKSPSHGVLQTKRES
jgi:hypothetical protein